MRLLLLTLALWPLDSTPVETFWNPGTIRLFGNSSFDLPLPDEPEPENDPPVLERLTTDADLIVTASLSTRQTDPLAATERHTYTVHTTLKGTQHAHITLTRPLSFIPPDAAPVLLFLRHSQIAQRNDKPQLDLTPRGFSLQGFASQLPQAARNTPADPSDLFNQPFELLRSLPLPANRRPSAPLLDLTMPNDDSVSHTICDLLGTPLPNLYYSPRSFQILSFYRSPPIPRALAKSIWNSQFFNPYKRIEPRPTTPYWDSAFNGSVIHMNASSMSRLVFTDPLHVSDLHPIDLSLFGEEFRLRWNITEYDFLLANLLDTRTHLIDATSWPAAIPLAVHNLYYIRAHAAGRLEQGRLPCPPTVLRVPALDRQPIPWRFILPCFALLILPLLHRKTRWICRPVNLLTLLSILLLASAIFMRHRSTTTGDQVLMTIGSGELELLTANRQLTCLWVNDHPASYPSQHDSFPIPAGASSKAPHQLRLPQTHHHTLLDRLTRTKLGLGFTLETGNAISLTQSFSTSSIYQINGGTFVVPPGLNQTITPTHPFRRFTLPFWPLILLFSLLPATRLLRAVYLPLRARRRNRRNHCPRCNYNLQHIDSKTCPECGLYRG